MPTTIYSKTFNTDNSGFQGYQLRHVIQPADLTAAASSNLIRVSYQFHTTANCTIDGSWLGIQGSGNVYNFAGNQVQMKFSGANTQTGIVGAVTIVSDYVPFTTYNPAVPLVVSCHLSGTAGDVGRLVAGGNVELFYKVEDNTQTGTTAPTGVYSTAGAQAFLFSKIEMESQLPLPHRMTYWSY